MRGERSRGFLRGLFVAFETLVAFVDFWLVLFTLLRGIYGFTDNNCRIMRFAGKGVQKVERAGI